MDRICREIIIHYDNILQTVGGEPTPEPTVEFISPTPEPTPTQPLTPASHNNEYCQVSIFTILCVWI